MPHPAKTQGPIPRQHLTRSVASSAKGATTHKATKKGGGGGKGTWGRAGEEYGSSSAAMDKKDPNYDSDNEAFVLEAYE